MRNYNEELFDHICDYVERTGLHMDIDEEEGCFSGGVKLEGPMRAARLRIFVLKDGLRVWGIYPMGADARSAKSLQRVGQYLHRANYGMNDGKFEFDDSDGEVGFSLFRDCTDGLPSDKVLNRSLVKVTAMLDLYAEGLMETLFTNRPIEEIAREYRGSDRLLARLKALRDAVRQKAEEDEEESDDFEAERGEPDEDEEDDEGEALTGEWMPTEEEQERSQKMHRFMQALILASLRAKAAAAAEAEAKDQNENKNEERHT